MVHYTIKVISVLTKQTKTFDTLDGASKSTGVSRYLIKEIRAGRKSNLVRGKGDRLFSFEFINKEVVAELTPAWDTMLDDNPATTMKFYSHVDAINFLSEGGRYMCKRATYYRRMGSQGLGVPCDTPILDCWNRPWIATFYSKGEFILNKR